MKRALFTFLHRVAWWASGKRVDWLANLIYRFACPYPIYENWTPRACIRSGNCGCNNRVPPSPEAPLR